MSPRPAVFFESKQKKSARFSITTKLRRDNQKIKQTKRVGLPRALLYYKYWPLWETFFRELGAEVIVSPETTKMIKNLSISFAPNEDCYSTKLYYGHVMALKDKVDYLFIPRLGSVHKTNSGCPKFVGLAETLQSMFDDLPPILMPYYSKAKAGHGIKRLLNIMFNIGFRFTKNPLKIILAGIKAIRAQKRHIKKITMTEKRYHKWEKNRRIIDNKEALRIALAGHSYILNDHFASLEIRDMLESLNVEYITSEQLPRKFIERQMQKLDFNLYFDYEREILGTIMHFLERKTVDGIIHLIIFSCGPDSVTAEMALQYAKREGTIPLLQLTFDELTGKAGLSTRVEAFIDLLERRRDRCQ
ncbi:MAG: acyl-CoA dehydratase activase-related protein [Candidatus Heimdallarchaeaceae archaeon]